MNHGGIVRRSLGRYQKACPISTIAGHLLRTCIYGCKLVLYTKSISAIWAFYRTNSGDGVSVGSTLSSVYCQIREMNLDRFSLLFIRLVKKKKEMKRPACELR